LLQEPGDGYGEVLAEHGQSGLSFGRRRRARVQEPLTGPLSRAAREIVMICAMLELEAGRAGEAAR
jgi:hypothetical protein